MGTYYRLNELGYRLPAGVHILPQSDISSIEASNQIVQDAENRAVEIVSNAEQAFDTKCKEGYAAGLADAQRESLERLLRENAVLDAGLHRLEAELTRLVSDCVHMLVNDFDDEARATSVVRAALRQMRREKRAELRVSPEQYKHFKASIQAIQVDFPEMELVDVVEDPLLVAPKIILESRVGRVEADVAGQLAAFELLLRDIAIRFGSPRS